MSTYQIITVGDVVIDELLLISNKNTDSRLHNKDDEICFRYGRKIIVDSCNFFIGGNAYNVAVGLSRAGIKSSLCTEIGDDEFSKKIINSLLQEKVDINLVKQITGAKSSFTIGIQFKYDRTLFVDHVKRDHDFNFDDSKTEWLYLTNLRKEWIKPYKKIAEVVKKNNVKLIFNPGTSQLKEGYQSIADILKLTFILFLNKEEAQELINTSNNNYSPYDLSESANVKKLLLTIQGMGVKTVVISDGEKGSYLIDEQKRFFHIGILPCDIVEKTGAGDAYATGFLAALIHKKTFQEAMKYGTINAISVITKIGPQLGLLSWQELQEQLQKYSSLTVQEF